MGSAPDDRAGLSAVSSIKPSWGSGVAFGCALCLILEVALGIVMWVLLNLGQPLWTSFTYDGLSSGRIHLLSNRGRGKLDCVFLADCAPSTKEAIYQQRTQDITVYTGGVRINGSDYKLVGALYYEGPPPPECRPRFRMDTHNSYWFRSDVLPADIQELDRQGRLILVARMAEQPWQYVMLQEH